MEIRSSRAFTVLLDHAQHSLGFQRPVFLRDWPAFRNLIRTRTAERRDGRPQRADHRRRRARRRLSLNDGLRPPDVHLRPAARAPVNRRGSAGQAGSALSGGFRAPVCHLAPAWPSVSIAWSCSSPINSYWPRPAPSAGTRFNITQGVRGDTATLVRAHPRTSSRRHISDRSGRIHARRLRTPSPPPFPASSPVPSAA